MKLAKFFTSLAITVLLVYLLNHGWTIGSVSIPPLGKFLDPFHGFWQNLEPAGHQGKKQLAIPGLKEPVTVIYDSLLIPHIFASNNDDLYLAQGYVTAQHRLWQMEFQTHAAAGRVSEIVAGDAVLNYDRRQRRLGMVYGAQNAQQSMGTHPAIIQYTKGVNLFIESLDYSSLPFEYKLLNYEPEPWTNLKCALLLKNMAQTLNMGDKDIQMTNALKLYGKQMVDLLYPDNEQPGDPIVEKPNGWNFSPVSVDTVPLALPEELMQVKKSPGSDPYTGSNNWAVSGSKTYTGHPMLAGDPHLDLSLPSIWYAVQLHAPDINTMGASLPGVPSVIIGFNDSIAWSVTNAQRDLVDWYKVTFRDKSRNQYLLDGEWVDTRKVIEHINGRDGAVFYDTVVYTHWGPVTYDHNFQAENELNGYAFRWIAHDPSEEITAFHRLNRAKNHAEFMEALNYFSSPAQNFVFASISGDIAMRVQGKFPVRRKDEGKFVLDGSKRSQGWQAYIPNAHNINDKNPARGFVSSANQYPADSTYPYYITATEYEAYRNRRINHVLRESENITFRDMMNLQTDNYNLKAAESLPMFLSYLDTTKLSHGELQAYRVLRSWDYFNNAASAGATYYEAWWDNLVPLLWDEMENDSVLLDRPTTYNTIKLLREKPDLSFFDIVATEEKESAGDVLRKAFSLGVEDIERWKQSHTTLPVWAEYKDSYIRHLLPPLTPLAIPVKTGGNHDIVNAHSRTKGPSWRMVVSLEPSGIKTWAAYPGGQSGNPGSAHHHDLLARWAKGSYYPLLFLKAPDENIQKIFYTTHLNPNAE
ncbi:MAG TPA: penicillin acylase family protein [Chryseosolibacter sp.]|nr:penicillin acylase family protein [Chryseosolibacter sp.]